MIVLSLHGWTSTPGGLKPKYLMSHGNPPLPDDDFDAAMRIAQGEYQPTVVVGSSKGVRKPLRW